MNNNKIYPLVYRSFFTIIALLGIVFNTKLFTAEFSFKTFLYYTTQSNVVALALFVYLLVRTIISIKTRGRKGDASFCPKMTFVIMIDIFLTFIIYWTLIAPARINTSFNLFSFANITVHAVTPLAVMGEYFIFNKKQNLLAKNMLTVLIYPAIYTFFTLILGSFKLVSFKAANDTTSYFPYFFFDYYKYGYVVIVYILAIAAFILLITYLISIAIKRKPSLNA